MQSGWNVQNWIPNHGPEQTRPPLDKVIAGLKEQGVTTFGAVGYCLGGTFIPLTLILFQPYHLPRPLRLRPRLRRRHQSRRRRAPLAPQNPRRHREVRADERTAAH